MSEGGPAQTAAAKSSATGHGRLGISIQELDKGLASSFGYSRSRGPGILVGDVPAFAAATSSCGSAE